MPFTTQQLQTIKTYINATPALAAKPNNPDGNYDIAIALNSNASPTFTVWKTSVPLGDVGRKFNGTELAGLTTGNQTRLQTVAQYLNTVNPSLPDNRQFFDDVFSGAGGTNTRAALLALWKSPAKQIEKLFATGTGSDGSPATLVYEGEISYVEVENARNLP